MSRDSVVRIQDKLWPDGPLGSYADFTLSLVTSSDNLLNFLFILMFFFFSLLYHFVSNSLLDPTKMVQIKFTNIMDSQGVVRIGHVTTLITQRSVHSK